MFLLNVGTGKQGSLANSADQDEMPHKVAFYLGQYCLLKF